ncbi:MAG: thermonuclease family protein [Halobacteriales archaeon]|jgi:micrococcal nuclease
MYRWPVLLGLLLVCGLAAGCVGTLDEGGAERSNATVVSVVDGDTVDVRFADGSTDTVRLLGVDTPELHGRTDPAEFEGVPNTTAGRACLRAVAENATGFAADLVADRAVTLEFDSEADRRGGYDRLLAYVYRGETHLNERLLVEGYARVYVTEFTQLDRFREAAATARAGNRGIWRCAS